MSEVASIRLGDLRPDGTLQVRGEGDSWYSKVTEALINFNQNL